MTLPAFNEAGDLPPGVHGASLAEVLERFGSQSAQRSMVADRLTRIYQLAVSTGHLARFIVFGSFITTKSQPNDVDVLLLMEDRFDLAAVTGNAGISTLGSTGPLWSERVLGPPHWNFGRRVGDDRILANSP